MDIEIKYRAKDGVCFDDINECEKYERYLQNQPGSLGYLLNKLKALKETDYFFGIIFYKENGDVKSFSGASIDLSEYYEGEIITQAMRDVQRRVTCTIGQVLEFFKDKDPSIFCGGTFLVSSDLRMKHCTGDSITCYEVLKGAK